MSSKNIYIIAGSNGSGKTTFAREFLPKYVGSPYFINADRIAHGLSPFSPEVVAIKAGKILLNEIKELVSQGKSFAFESTLSGKSYFPFLQKAKKAGFHIHIFFLWIPNSELANARIRERVIKGGHDIPEEDVKRRFSRSINNFFNLYKPLSYKWYIIDNSSSMPKLVARGLKDITFTYNSELYKRINKES